MPALLSWSFRARHFHRWGQAVYIFIDCGLAPIDAIRASNKIIYGKKWTIFWGSFLLGITMYVIAFVLFFVFGRTMPAMVVIMGFVMYVAFISVSLGAAADIYGVLSPELDALNFHGQNLAGFQNLYRF